MAGVRGRIVAGVLVGVVLAGVPAASQRGDEAVWKTFLAWLQGAPPLSGPLEALRGFQQSVQDSGAAPEEVNRQMAVVRRLMSERGDWWPLLFDKVYASDRPNFSQNPSALLVEAIEGRTPGRGLDVAMGQGRNALFLAQRGWSVTGFDVSGKGLEVASASAAKAGVPLRAVNSRIEDFDYGTSQWDLIALIYVPSIAHQGPAMATLARALKPGGLLVIESFAYGGDPAQRRAVDIDPAALKAALSGFDLLRFDDREAVSEWEPAPTRLVRVIARKR